MEKRVWQCGDFSLELGQKTYIMGILNATPDSFSGDGTDAPRAIERGLALLEAGADILDIGGESTRPGAEKVSLEEELQRVLPVLEGLSGCGAPLSIDTTKAEVARLALEAGAAIVNDISGATFDPQMLPICAQSPCGVVLMHLRGTPQSMGWSQSVEGAAPDVVEEVLDFWSARIVAAQMEGIALERICLDAGFGFGKSVEENLELLRRGPELAELGLPILWGTSRKSTIGKVLDGALVEARLWGTAATVALSIAGGADIVRVHDVAEMRDVARVSDAIVRPPLT